MILWTQRSEQIHGPSEIKSKLPKLKARGTSAQNKFGCNSSKVTKNNQHFSKKYFQNIKHHLNLEKQLHDGRR